GLGLLVLLRAPGAPLFPYTTLFRSICSTQRFRRLAALRRQRLSSSPRLERYEFVPRPYSDVPSSACVFLFSPACVKNRLVGSVRSEEHTSELQPPYDLVCRLLLETK